MVTYGDYFSRKTLHNCGVSPNTTLFKKEENTDTGMQRTENIRSKMILQVHDELNFSVYPEEKEKVQQIVIEEMEKAYAMQVPLRADCGWGKNWLEAH